jgi:molybdate transport system permease protein
VFDDFQKPALLVTHNIQEAYRLGQELLVLVKGKIAAHGPKDQIFRHPPTQDVARLTGCKNFSRARLVDGAMVEATDWGCTVRVTQPVGFGAIAYLGIRAHHIQFPDEQERAGGENVFPCSLVRASETPFRVTLYLNLNEAKGGTSSYHLQAEITKDEWQRLEKRRKPWMLRLPAELIFSLPG